MDAQMVEKERTNISKEALLPICWVDEIGLLSLFSLLSIRKRHSIRFVKYLSATKFGKISMSLIPFCKYFRFEQIQYHLSDMHFDDKTDGFWRMHIDPSTLALQMAQQAGVLQGLLNTLNNKYNKEKIGLFLKKKIAQDMRPYIKLANIVRWFNEQRDESDQSPQVILARKCLWYPYIAGYNKKSILNIACYPNIKSGMMLIFNLWRIPAALIVNLIVTGASLLVTKDKLSREQRALPKISVLHTHGVDLSQKTDYFWLPFSGIDYKDILVYFRIPYRPATPEIIQTVKNYDMSFVDLIPKRSKSVLLGFGTPEMYIYPSWYYLKNLFSLCCELVKLTALAVFSACRKVNIWQLKVFSSLLYHVCLYEAFFTDHNVKVNYALFEIGEELIAANLGAEIAKTVDVSHHFSNYPAVWVDHAKTQDVYFSWGPYFKNMFEKAHYQVSHLLYCGYPYDSYFKQGNDEAKALRQKLTDRGMTFIISFLDEAYAKDDCLDKNDFRETYKALFDALAKDKTLGLIIKPKRMSYYFTELPEIYEEIRKFESQGRCIFLDENVYPHVAAQASDITVGLIIFNTAALEAAFAGKPTAVINVGRIDFHPLYEKGLGKIVFNDAATLVKAVQENRKKWQPGFADYTPYLDAIDPFRDGQSSKRIGGYIKILFDEICASQDNDKAVAKANQWYRENFGQDKVVDYKRQS